MDLMGVLSSCTVDFDLDFDFDVVFVLGLDPNLEGRREGILVDFIWSLSFVDLATTFAFGLRLVFVFDLDLVLGIGLTAVVVVVPFDLVVWMRTGVTSSGSIFISISIKFPESVGDEGILIPIASNISQD
jgi:hypothetical protein